MNYKQVADVDALEIALGAPFSSEPLTPLVTGTNDWTINEVDYVIDATLTDD